MSRYNISLNTVSKYRKEMNLKAILAVKAVNTTITNKTHKKWSYELKGLDIIRANQVWSTYIAYRNKGNFMSNKWRNGLFSSYNRLIL